ncbi:MAG: hypothetical protein E7258_06400 [Lachnospiraceae bacterium]|nr:hypothetical protein [Lachnospiraceae bacterium]
MYKTINSLDSSSFKRNYKDTVFRMLFSDRHELLALYNAINETNYHDVDALTITTLENAIYMSVKNDISCVVDMRLNLYEHQSTVNPNIPLRNLDYVSRTFSAFYANQDIYSPRIIKLPNPKFIVFYNGEKPQPARKDFRLSDAFFYRDEHPNLELIVTQININPGYNDELLDSCPTLKEYMLYVDRVRSYQKDMSLADAVNKAVNKCIKEGILVEFLRKNKLEVISMSIFEYDEKLHEKTMMDIGREEGMQLGLQQGLDTGIEVLISTLKDMDFSDDKIIEKLVEKFGLDKEKAKEYLKK